MKKLLLSAVFLTALTSGACASPRYVAYRIGPPPPRPPVRMGVAPGPGYVWADGYYDLRGRNWAWVPGHWVRAPRGRTAWVPGRWQPSRNGYRWHEGYWR